MTVPRVRAPELTAGTWFNTDRPLTLADLRGRFVLLDFWTSCCGNCLHVLDELRPFEAKYRAEVSVIGVHSPKFEHERADRAVADAIDRYEVAHPVVNDPDMRLWQQYAVRAWPTLVLIDPDGYVVAQAAGEGQISALDETVAALLPTYDLRPGDGPYRPRVAETSALRYPAKAIALPGGHLLVADAGHHQLVEVDGDDPATVVRRIGSGRRGRDDGPAERASFAEPGGLALLPSGTAPFDVVVADTANHLLRGVRLADGAVVATLDLPAELRDARTVTGPVPSVLSPWDVAWWPALGRLVVAAAGVHLLLAVDPATGRTEILAGTTVEALRDGPALDGWLAQPSGLAVDGDRLWFVDAETSSLRRLGLDGELHTAVGEGLFDFGFVDGPGAGARFQHPLGVTRLDDGSLAVLDTYNGAVRRYEPTTGEVTTLATDLREPTGGLVRDGELIVVESAAHRLVRPVMAVTTIDGPVQETPRPVTRIAPDALLAVVFTAAPGRELDERYGPATRLTVGAAPEGLVLDGAGQSTELTRRLRLAGSGVLQVVAQAASCDTQGEHPACYLARQDWGVPVEVADDGVAVLELPLFD